LASGKNGGSVWNMMNYFPCLLEMNRPLQRPSSGPLITNLDSSLGAKTQAPVFLVKVRGNGRIAVLALVGEAGALFTGLTVVHWKDIDIQGYEKCGSAVSPGKRNSTTHVFMMCRN